MAYSICLLSVFLVVTSCTCHCAVGTLFIRAHGVCVLWGWVGGGRLVGCVCMCSYLSMDVCHCIAYM